MNADHQHSKVFVIIAPLIMLCSPDDSINVVDEDEPRAAVKRRLASPVSRQQNCVTTVSLNKRPEVLAMHRHCTTCDFHCTCIRTGFVWPFIHACVCVCVCVCVHECVQP